MEWLTVEFACCEPASNRLRDNNGGILLRYCVECPALAIGRCVRSNPDKIKTDLDEAIARRDGTPALAGGARGARRPDPRPRGSKVCTRCRKVLAVPGRTRCQKCIDDGNRYVHTSRSHARQFGRVCAWAGCEKVVRNSSVHCRSHASLLRENKLRTTRLKERGG